MKLYVINQLKKWNKLVNWIH